MSLPESDADLDILILHVLAMQDPGFGLTETEIMRAVNGMSDEQQKHIISRIHKK